MQAQRLQTWPALTKLYLSVTGENLDTQAAQTMHKAKEQLSPCYLLHTCTHRNSGEMSAVQWPALHFGPAVKINNRRGPIKLQHGKAA